MEIGTAMMAANVKPRSRAETSRVRRAARAAATGRTVEIPAGERLRGAPPPPSRRTAKRRAMSANRSRWERAMPWSGVEVALPALPRVHLDWRMASLTMSLLLVGLLMHLFSSPQYFVEAINLAGAVHVPGAEVYEASGVDRQHIFWIDPNAARANVERVPGVASATVELSWPNVVNVVVVERQPVLSWQQGGETVWVDQQGAFFPSREELPGLLPIVVDDAQTPLLSGEHVPAQAIQGALQLRSLRPNIELLHYDSVRGLSYQDGRGWRGYFGVGTDMEVKLAVYETLVANLLSRGIHPTVVSVSNPAAPFYRK